MRHYGAGPLQDPTACKVTQLLLRCRIAPDPRITSQPQPKHGEPPTETPLTAEPSCKDEARIGQKNKITRRWARRGTRPSAPHDQRTRSAYIFGAISTLHDCGRTIREHSLLPQEAAMVFFTFPEDARWNPDRDAVEF